VPGGAVGDALRPAWWLALVAWAVLWGPVYLHAFDGLWQDEEHSHGPLVLAVAAWLFWQLAPALRNAAGPARPAWAWPLIALGLLSYLFGRTFAFPLFVFGAQLPLAAGFLLLFRGVQALRLAWFPLVFLIFSVPLPGMLVDAGTNFLKQWISVVVTDVLHGAGYPISRTGVTIAIGKYQLLVADACSGLHSLFSLSALGALYVYLMDRGSRLHNAIMLALIVPTALFANLVRVCILVLVTYEFGEEAGRGFLHGFAGLLLMAVSLLVLFAVDAGLSRWIKPVRRPSADASASPVASPVANASDEATA
jgi:exosortase B